jgi:cyanophycinase
MLLINAVGANNCPPYGGKLKMTVGKYSALGAMALLLSACGGSNSDSVESLTPTVTIPTTGPENGALVVAGGNLKDPAIFRRFLYLAGGPDAQIVVIPTAAEGDGQDIGSRDLEGLRGAGATNLIVLHTRDPAEAETEAFVAPLKEATGVWFVGGRQWRIADSYLGTLTEQEIRAVLDRGGAIGGTSAGATIQGSYLARGDTQANTIMMGDHQEGFAYIKNVAIDQHLLMRNRQFDLLEIIEAHPEMLGIGLDEDTAIIVRGDEFEVMGQGYVAIYDSGRTVGHNGQFYLLAPGDHFNLRERQASRPGDDSEPFAIIRAEAWQHCTP